MSEKIKFTEFVRLADELNALRSVIEPDPSNHIYQFGNERRPPTAIQVNGYDVMDKSLRQGIRVAAYARARAIMDRLSGASIDMSDAAIVDPSACKCPNPTPGDIYLSVPAGAFISYDDNCYAVDCRGRKP